MSPFLIFFFLAPVRSAAGRSGANTPGANALLAEGKKLLRNGHFEEARAALDKCLILTADNEDKRLRADCLLNLGLVIWNQGDVKASSEYYGQALSLAEEIDLPQVKTMAEGALRIAGLYSEGVKYQDSGLADESAESFEKAIALARNQKSRHHEIKALRALSRNYASQPDSEEFFNLSRAALEIAREVHHRTEIVNALSSLGAYHFQKFDLSAALIHHFEALKLAREIEYAARIPGCLINLANVYLRFGDFQKSYEYYAEALSLNRERKRNKQIPYNLNDLGLIFRGKAIKTGNEEDFQRALACFDESLNLFDPQKDNQLAVMTWSNMGIVYAGLKDYEESLKYFRLCSDRLNNSPQDQLAETLVINTADIQLELGNQGEAEQLFLRALKWGQDSSAAHILRRAHFGLARINETRGNYDRAIFHYIEAVENLEKVGSSIILDVDKAKYIQPNLNIYEHLLNFYSRLNSEVGDNRYCPDMFFAAERGKARSFLENLMESRVDVPSEISAEYRKKEEELTARISSHLQGMSRQGDLRAGDSARASEEILKTDEEYTFLLQRMLQEKANLVDVISPKPFNLGYIQGRFLGTDTVLIEYYLGEKKSFLFFISKDRLEVFDLPSQPEIRDSVKAYLKILAKPAQDDRILKNASRRLYEELLGPAEEMISGGVTNLVIIPDGILYYLPFETLIVSAPGSSGRNEYLISKYTISYMPSASSLLFLNDRRTDHPYSKEILLLGEPDYSMPSSAKNGGREDPMQVVYELYKSHGYEFLPLPFSRKEIKSISKYFPSKKADIFLRREASEKTVKSLSLEDYRVIHLACHSFLDEVFPLRSSLVLSFNGQGEEDGFLKVREIYNLELRPELVVLSACHTGKGKMEGSDGVLGLPRIFFYAGAMSVVSTLWGINDRSTVSFMDLFYRNLSEGHSKAYALRRAKIDMIESAYSHPYYWGAFILNGDYRAPIFSK